MERARPLAVPSKNCLGFWSENVEMHLDEKQNGDGHMERQRDNFSLREGYASGRALLKIRKNIHIIHIGLLTRPWPEDGLSEKYLSGGDNIHIINL